MRKNKFVPHALKNFSILIGSRNVSHQNLYAQVASSGTLLQPNVFVLFLLRIGMDNNVLFVIKAVIGILLKRLV